MFAVDLRSRGSGDEAFIASGGGGKHWSRVTPLKVAVVGVVTTLAAQ
jgi:hypothetical protein